MTGTVTFTLSCPSIDGLRPVVATRRLVVTPTFSVALTAIYGDVVMSAPAKDSTPMFVCGVNFDKYV